MISIYDFIDYRDFLKNWMTRQMPLKKGLQSQMARAANVSTTFMSRVLSSDKHLSMEQGLDLSYFLGLTENEVEYFFLLIEIGRAGNHKLKLRLQQQAKKISKKVSMRIINTQELNDDQKAIFYSSWIYSAVRNLVATPGSHDAHSISKRLSIPISIASEVISFLTSIGLCKKTENSIVYSAKKSHVSIDSPLLINHHRNWRLRALHNMEFKNNENLFFTSPMSLSRETAEELRSEMTKFIEKTMKKVEPSPSENIYCFNLDWFEI